MNFEDCNRLRMQFRCIVIAQNLLIISALIGVRNRRMITLKNEIRMSRIYQ